MSTETQASAGSVRRWLRGLGRLAHGALAVAVLASLMARFAVSDTLGPSRWNLFLPPLLLTPFALIVAATVPWRRSLRIAVLGVVAVLGGAALYADQPLLFRGPRAHAAAPEASPSAVRVLLYNVEGLRRGAERVRERIRAADADLVFLVQAARREEQAAAEYAPVLDGREPVTVIETRHVAFGRPPLTLIEAWVHEQNARFTRMALDLDGVDVDVLLVHLRSPGNRDDAVAFAGLEQALAKLHEPALVLGDFNAPRGSRRLRRAMAGWRDAAFTSQDRLLATWLMPVPLWQIDHVFTRGLDATSFEILPSTASDHAAVVFELAADRG